MRGEREEIRCNEHKVEDGGRVKASTTTRSSLYDSKFHELEDATADGARARVCHVISLD